MLKLWRTLFVVALGVTISVTLAPMRGQAPGFPGLDKLVHASLFLLNTFFGVLSFPARGRSAVLAGLVVLGPVLELLQSYIPSRAASVADAVADTLGVVLGVLAARCFARSASDPN